MRLAIQDIIVLRRVEIVGLGNVAQADLLLDTGAALTTLSRTAVEIAGYDLTTVHATQRIVTGNGVVQAPVLKIYEIRVQELSVKDILVCVHDIPEVAHVEGLLGVNFLRHFRSVIDYPGGFIEMTRPA